MPKNKANGASLRDAMIERGWRWLAFTDPNACTANGSIYCTLAKGPVRLAIAGAMWISERRGDVYRAADSPKTSLILMSTSAVGSNVDTTAP